MSDLVERLRDAMRRIGTMASEGRPPKMSIPARPDHDDDIFICDAIRDAITALTADSGLLRAAEICDAHAERLTDEARQAVKEDRDVTANLLYGKADSVKRVGSAILAAASESNADVRLPVYLEQCAPSAPDVVQVHPQWWKKIKEVLTRRFPRCRDCADENGVCPSSGLPCNINDALLAASKEPR